METGPVSSTGWVDAAGAGDIADKCAWFRLIDNPDAGSFPPSRSGATPP